MVLMTLFLPLVLRLCYARADSDVTPGVYRRSFADSCPSFPSVSHSNHGHLSTAPLRGILLCIIDLIDIHILIILIVSDSAFTVVDPAMLIEFADLAPPFV